MACIKEPTFKINPKFRLTTRHLSVVWYCVDRFTVECEAAIEIHGRFIYSGKTTVELLAQFHDGILEMNARGKQLTPFENFKADLIGYIRQRAKDKNEGVNTDRPDYDKDWDALLDPRTGIPIKLDTDWTEIFWNHRSKNNTIDEIFFSFLNRVFWEELVSTRNAKADNAAEDPDSENSAKILEANTSYRFLIADDIEDYHDLSPYKFY